MHETYPNGVSEHAVQATAFGPDVLEANILGVSEIRPEITPSFLFIWR